MARREREAWGWLAAVPAFAFGALVFFGVLCRSIQGTERLVVGGAWILIGVLSLAVYFGFIRLGRRTRPPDDRGA